MKQKKVKLPERKSRKFFAVTDESDGVRQVTGWHCGDKEESMWWVPELGYTLTTGHHLFETKFEAVTKAILNLSNEIEDRRKILKRLSTS